MNLKLVRFVKSKKRKLLRATAIPHFFTFANACFGFFAIIYVLDANVHFAALTLLLSIVADMLDGLCARRLQVSSLIGAELDSLADAVSFCLAPAILAYRITSPVDLLLMSSLTLYLCSGMFRLARFNAQHKKTAYFIGLPSPAAAFVIINLVLYKSWFLINFPKILTNGPLAAIVLFVSLLMISPVPFPSWKTYSFKSKPELGLCSMLILIFSLTCFIHRAPVLLIFSLGYISAGCLLYSLVATKRFLASIL